MTRFLLVCLAGAIGTGLRYAVGLWAVRNIGAGFPYGTLTVNVVGCFIIAAVAQVGLTTMLLSDTARITIMTGFVGGLTTYSAFNLETTRMLQDRGWALAAFYVSATMFVSFGAGLLGQALARRLVGP